MTIREALKLSINTIAAQVTAEVGPSQVAALANRFGIKSELRPEYSLALGSSEVTLQELTHAYSVFANEGLLRPALYAPHRCRSPRLSCPLCTADDIHAARRHRQRHRTRRTFR